MCNPRLSERQIERLLRFKGYGNPAGRFWFIGMEEGSDQPLNELTGRADMWGEIEDLAKVCRPWAPNLDLTKCITPTWWIMCQIVGKLSRESRWCDTGRNGFVRTYQSTKLGRRNGQTFLTEILPLPKKNTGDWPFGFLYPTRQDYEDAVLSDRIKGLRNLFARHRPPYVFCYGKAFWPHHKKLFRDAEFRPILDGEAEIATLGRSTIALTKFLDPTITGKTVEFVERLCDEVLASPAGSREPRGADNI